jgi:hypothetical protein
MEMGNSFYSEIKDFGGMGKKKCTAEILSLVPDNEHFIMGSSVWFNVVSDL